LTIASILTATFPRPNVRVSLPSHLPLRRKSASWRSGVCAKGDVLFEGNPRAGAAEYVNNKEQFAQIRYAKVIKKYQSAKKNRLPFLGAVYY